MALWVFEADDVLRKGTRFSCFLSSFQRDIYLKGTSEYMDNMGYLHKRHAYGCI